MLIGIVDLICITVEGEIFGRTLRSGFAVGESVVPANESMEERCSCECMDLRRDGMLTGHFPNTRRKDTNRFRGIKIQ
jgi:hypothetical protein